MIFPTRPKDEALRLQALHYYDILDTTAERDFDDIVELASQICDVPISLMTLIDYDRQWFKSRKGINDTETARDTAFCAHAIHSADIMEIEDATKDERFFDNPYVIGDPDIRFYAGMPLVTPEGFKLGTLCVIDRKPRQLTEAQQFALRVLAQQIMSQMEYRAKVKELRRLHDANNKMLSIVGHDVRSPLNSLAALLKLHEQGALSPEEMKQLMADVSKSLGFVETLFASLMQWAVSQFEGRGPRLQSLNVYDVVAAELNASIHQLQSKGNSTALHIDANLAVHADVDMLRFVVRNLIHNANKFTQQGSISIATTLQNGHVELCVRDTGTGMNDETLSSLFDWGKRKSIPGTDGEKGSGVGLQVCKELIEKMGGTLRAESKAGEGSSFYFTLARPV